MKPRKGVVMRVDEAIEILKTKNPNHRISMDFVIDDDEDVHDHLDKWIEAGWALPSETEHFVQEIRDDDSGSITNDEVQAR